MEHVRIGAGHDATRILCLVVSCLKTGFVVPGIRIVELQLQLHCSMISSLQCCKLRVIHRLAASYDVKLVLLPQRCVSWLEFGQACGSRPRFLISILRLPPHSHIVSSLLNLTHTSRDRDWNRDIVLVSWLAARVSLIVPAALSRFLGSLLPRIWRWRLDYFVLFRPVIVFFRLLLDRPIEVRHDDAVWVQFEGTLLRYRTLRRTLILHHFNLLTYNLGFWLVLEPSLDRGYF